MGKKPLSGEMVCEGKAGLLNFGKLRGGPLASRAALNLSSSFILMRQANHVWLVM